MDYQNNTPRPSPMSQLSDEMIRSLMPEMNIKDLHLTGQQLLIFHEDQNMKREDSKPLMTPGGIQLTDKSSKEVYLGMITTGTIIKIGPQIQDKEMQPGKKAVFFRSLSEGSIKDADGKIYVLFNEYNIRGILPGEKTEKKEPKQK